MTDGFDLGGSGGSSFSFGPQGSQPGAHVTGTVLDMKEVQETNYDTKEPEFWANGDPKMQYQVTLQTELRDPNNPHDDGKRNIYLNGYRKPHPKTGTSGTLFAVLEAVRVVTGGTQLQRGGKLTLQWISGMGFTGDPRHYQAWYEAPAMALAGPGQPPAAPPVQQAPPQSVQQTIAHQAAVGQTAPQFAQPAAAPPAQAVQAAPVQHVATEQGPVNPTTGEIAGPLQQAPANTVATPPQFVNAQGHPATREAVAGLRAAGIDPAAVYAGYDGSLG